LLPLLTDSIPTAFTLGAKWRKALLAYEKSHQWKEAFALTSAAHLDETEISSLATRMAGEHPQPIENSLSHIHVQEDLIGRKRYVEAARILLDYGDDVKGALVALVQGNDVSEALRVVRRLNFPSEHCIMHVLLGYAEELLRAHRRDYSPEHPCIA
jgi:hypothetical protein